MSRHVIALTSWNSGPNFGALETDPPGQSGISIDGSFLSHGRTDLKTTDFPSYILYELAGFNMI
jgi:hypothetical protein